MGGTNCASNDGAGTTGFMQRLRARASRPDAAVDPCLLKRLGLSTDDVIEIAEPVSRALPWQSMPAVAKQRESCTVESECQDLRPERSRLRQQLRKCHELRCVRD